MWGELIFSTIHLGFCGSIRIGKWTTRRNFSLTFYSTLQRSWLVVYNTLEPIWNVGADWESSEVWWYVGNISWLNSNLQCCCLLNTLQSRYRTCVNDLSVISHHEKKTCETDFEANDLTSLLLLGSMLCAQLPSA